MLELKRKYKLCLLTNGWPHVQKRKVQKLEIEKYFDAVFYAEEEGAETVKPHEKYFLRILKQYKLDPKEVLMIGDDCVADGEGAKKAGIRFFDKRLRGS